MAGTGVPMRTLQEWMGHRDIVRGREQLGKRLAGTDPPSGLIQLGVAEISARPRAILAG